MHLRIDGGREGVAQPARLLTAPGESPTKARVNESPGKALAVGTFGVEHGSGKTVLLYENTSSDTHHLTLAMAYSLMSSHSAEVVIGIVDPEDKPIDWVIGNLQNYPFDLNPEEHPIEPGHRLLGSVFNRGGPPDFANGTHSYALSATILTNGTRTEGIKQSALRAGGVVASGAITGLLVSSLRQQIQF